MPEVESPVGCYRRRVTSTGFQRARTAEQQQQRRDDILAAARSLLADEPLEAISLRELARTVGLSKSNVVRYFPTREAVFLAVLVEDLAVWLDDVAATLSGRGRARSERGRNAEVARAVAASLVRHPRCCELLSAAQGVLERNVDLETARWFKQSALENLVRLGDLVGARVPALTARQRFEVAGLTWITVAGAWPASRPAPAVAQALSAPHLAPLVVDLEAVVTTTLTAVLDGMTRP
jgi:AcrR family transcriptional regulator